MRKILNIGFFTYVLFSESHNRLYIGHTHDLEQRLKEHNSGKTKSTKGFIPWELIYYEKYQTRKEAIDREKYLKSGVGREYIRGEIINQRP